MKVHVSVHPSSLSRPAALLPLSPRACDVLSFLTWPAAPFIHFPGPAAPAIFRGRRRPIFLLIRGPRRLFFRFPGACGACFLAIPGPAAPFFNPRGLRRISVVRVSAACGSELLCDTGRGSPSKAWFLKPGKQNQENNGCFKTETTSFLLPGLILEGYFETGLNLVYNWERNNIKTILFSKIQLISMDPAIRGWF